MGLLLKGVSTIKSSVFSAIRDINETLALTNEPGQLVNMSLDTISQVMEIECCWIQTVDGTRHARLAAERGLTKEMQAELASIDMAEGLVGEVIGLGHRILIPDLSVNGAYGLESFRKAGFKWLIAVPLMTYRVHGILGIASRNKRLFKKETPELAMVIGGLIGTALNKSRLSQKSGRQEKPGPVRPVDDITPPKAPEAGPPPGQTAVPAPGAPRERHAPTREEKPFDAHSRRMKKFRGAHEAD